MINVGGVFSYMSDEFIVSTTVLSLSFLIFPNLFMQRIYITLEKYGVHFLLDITVNLTKKCPLFLDSMENTLTCIPEAEFSTKDDSKESHDVPSLFKGLIRYVQEPQVQQLRA